MFPVHHCDIVPFNYIFKGIPIHDGRFIKTIVSISSSFDLYNTFPPRLVCLQGVFVNISFTLIVSLCHYCDDAVSTERY